MRSLSFSSSVLHRDAPAVCSGNVTRLVWQQYCKCFPSIQQQAKRNDKHTKYTLVSSFPTGVRMHIYRVTEIIHQHTLLLRARSSMEILLILHCAFSISVFILSTSVESTPSTHTSLSTAVLFPLGGKSLAEPPMLCLVFVFIWRCWFPVITARSKESILNDMLALCSAIISTNDLLLGDCLPPSVCDPLKSPCPPPQSDNTGLTLNRPRCTGPAFALPSELFFSEGREIVSPGKHIIIRVLHKL